MYLKIAPSDKGGKKKRESKLLREQSKMDLWNVLMLAKALYWSIESGNSWFYQGGRAAQQAGALDSAATLPPVSSVAWVEDHCSVAYLLL